MLSKRSIVVIMVILFAAAFALSGAYAGQPEGRDRMGQDGNARQEGGPPGMQGKMPPGGKAEVHFIGYAVEAEEKFEMAHVFIIPPPPAGAPDPKIKKPDGMIDIGKEHYFIVEAKIETEEVEIDGPQQGPGPQMNGGQESQAGGGHPAGGKKKAVRIKSCDAKISKSYFERPGLPPTPGQDPDSEKMPQGKADIVGDLKIATSEKEVGGERKVSVLHGKVSTGERNFYLYLEPRMMPAGGGPQGPGQGQQKQQ